MNEDARQLARDMSVLRQRVQRAEGIARQAIPNPPWTSPAPQTTSIVVVQAAHGFTLGQALRLTGSNTYGLAQANSTGTASVAGIVGMVVDANTFVLVTAGVITGVSGFTPGAQYYLDAAIAGNNTTVAPSIAVPIFMAISATVILVQIGSALGGNLSPPSSIQAKVSQASHGFTVGQVLQYNTGGNYILAEANSPLTDAAIGVVTSVIDSNNFIITFAGLCTLSGLTDGSIYYLSDATPGAMVTTPTLADSMQIGYAMNGNAFVVAISPTLGQAQQTGRLITQAAHGFATGQVVYYDVGSSSYGLAVADGSKKQAVAGVVGDVPSTSQFFLTIGGMVRQTTVSIGSQVYLSPSTPGALTTTPPINNAISIGYQFSDSILVDIKALPTQVSMIVTQAAHGLSVGQAVYINASGKFVAASGGTYAKSQVLGIVGQVIDASTFQLVTSGVVTGLSGLTPGSQYYVSSAGNSSVNPTNQFPARTYQALTSTSALVNCAGFPFEIDWGVWAKSATTIVGPSSGSLVIPSGATWLLVQLVGANGGPNNYVANTSIGYVASSSGGSPTTQVQSYSACSGAGAGAMIYAAIWVGDLPTITYGAGGVGSTGAGTAGSVGGTGGDTYLQLNLTDVELRAKGGIGAKAPSSGSASVAGSLGGQPVTTINTSHRIAQLINLPGSPGSPAAPCVGNASPPPGADGYSAYAGSGALLYAFY